MKSSSKGTRREEEEEGRTSGSAVCKKMASTARDILSTWNLPTLVLTYKFSSTSRWQHTRTYAPTAHAEWQWARGRAGLLP